MSMLYHLIAIRIAGKIEDLKSKYPENSDAIDEFSKSDPSGKNKYVEWAVKQLIDGNVIQDIIPTVELFDKNKSRLKNRDINQYKDLKDLESELKNLPQSKSKEKTDSKTSGSTKLYEDDQFLFIRIDSKRACVEYGKGTKWCITMENASYYEEYTNDNVVFYFLINKKPSDNDTNSTDKIAYSVQRGHDNEIIRIKMFDSADRVIEKNPYSVSGKIDQIIQSDAPKVPMSNLFRLENRLMTEDEMIELISDKDKSIRDMVAHMVDPEYLPQMMNDENEYVRNSVAQRIDPKYLPRMMNDESDFVRSAIAKRIDPEYLHEMMNDKDYGIRDTIAERIDPKYLPEMMNDKNERVRRVVVRRIDPKYLPEMMNDENDTVRAYVVQRIDPKYLPEMMNDENESIRKSAAGRIDPEYLPRIIDDKSKWVRVEVSRRIDPEYLPQMIDDEYEYVRSEVARRIDPKYLPEMMKDFSASVRAEVAERIDPKYLPEMMNDESEWIRDKVARLLRVT